MIKEWNKAPTVKEVFYDDFHEGIRTDIWRALNEKWSSQHNNGYSEDNCLYTVNSEIVKNEGASGGIVVIKSNGDFTSAPDKKRQGGGVVTKKLFGAGLYETRVKIVPRAGQCSAMWTYYNNWESVMQNRQYSEIDIELPYGGDFREYSGTTYENYMSANEKNCRSETIKPAFPINDGKWHNLAFEWRTDTNSGDEGIIWYLDGEQVLFINEAIPKYSATFWIASLFQDSIAWLGDPQFETAYMYIDWVKITSYNDPILDGSAEKESKLSFKGIDISHLPLPVTDYIANSNFDNAACISNFKGREICSWKIENGFIKNGKLFLDGGKAKQLITAQYYGYKYEIETEILELQGDVHVYFEYLSGKANCEEPKLTVIGESEHLLLNKKTTKGTIKVSNINTEHLRIVVSAQKAEIEQLHMRLL